jgi:hypothetical protein
MIAILWQLPGVAFVLHSIIREHNSRFLNHRGQPFKEDDSQESSATEDGPPMLNWSPTLKSCAKIPFRPSSRAPSSPLPASPSTSSLPSLQRHAIKLDRSNNTALEALNKAIDECTAANESEQREELERQRARALQKHLRPAIDILRVNSVAGSSYSMLSLSKSKEDGSSLLRSSNSLDHMSPRPLWMDMVERRQEAW